MGELSPEQIQELQTKVEVLEKEKNESATKLAEYETAKADLEAKNKELEGQVNPNWQKARQTIEALKEVAKSKGVELNDDGTVKSNPGNIDISAIEEKAREAARGELLGNRLQEELEQYDSESAKVVKYYYNKLTQGEAVTVQNLSKFVKQAENAARGD